MKLNVRISSDRRLHVGREHRLAVKFARELVDDLARNRLAILVLALTRLHDVGQQGLDLDDLALFRFFRNFEPRLFCHDCLPVLSSSAQPPQPPMVTFTSFWLVKNSPLLVFATAMMFWVVARRIRVDASALPANGDKWKVATPGFGLPSATMRISLM